MLSRSVEILGVACNGTLLQQWLINPLATVFITKFKLYVTLFHPAHLPFLLPSTWCFAHAAFSLAFEHTTEHSPISSLCTFCSFCLEISFPRFCMVDSFWPAQVSLLSCLPLQVSNHSTFFSLLTATYWKLLLAEIMFWKITLFCLLTIFLF